MPEIILYILVGLGAQLIDGAMGMGYGVISTTFLLSIGVSPVFASAGVHTAEVFTTAISGFSHWRLGNVKKEVVLRLLIPGVIGAGIGAYLLTQIPGDVIKPYISAYLLVMGFLILWKVIRKTPHKEVHTNLSVLGLLGGFLDTIGGGGWGPLVSTTLVARGKEPRFVIGSVNLAEFFVTLTASITFLLTIGFGNWQMILGLMIGGALAAPLAAFACQKLQGRVLMTLMGMLIIALSLRTILLAII